MSLLGIGIDILYISRIDLLLQRIPSELKFAKKILSSTELIEWQVLSNDANQSSRYLANRFCIKESIYKALNPHYPTINWKQVSIHKKYSKILIKVKKDLVYGKGQPIVIFDPIVQTELGYKLNAQISLSHEKDIIVSCCVLQKVES